MKEKICVYTCMTGDYDSIKEIPNKEDGIDYYFFTNNKNIKSNTWNVVYIEDNNLSNLELARKTKILGTKEINDKYDILVWMDAAVTFKKPIKEFIKTYLKKEDVFSCFKHGQRNNVKDEMYAVYRGFKEDKENIVKLMEFYSKEGYNYDNGLIESTVYIKRPKDKKVIETMNIWYETLRKYSRRDQLSFNYSMFKTGLSVHWIDEYVFDNDWFLWDNHSPKKKITTYSVYYGDLYKSYDFDLEDHFKYINENDTYTIKFKTRKEISPIMININCTPCTRIKINKISGFNNYEILNKIIYKKNDVFITTMPVIKILDEIKENTNILITFELSILDEQEKMDIVNALGNEVYWLRKSNEKLNKMKIYKVYKYIKNKMK